MDSAAANTAFTTTPLDFAKKYALSPGEDANVDSHVTNSRPVGPKYVASSTKGNIRNQFANPTTGRANTGQKIALKLGIPSLMYKIKPIRKKYEYKAQIPLQEYQEKYQLCYAKFEKTRAPGNMQFGMYAIDFRPAIMSDGTVRATRFPAWFLPWDQSGTMTHMTIPRTTYLHTKAGTSRPSGIGGTLDLTWGDFAVNPPWFFTSGLSGCSVFISGPADNPTIYHAGIGTSLNDYSTGTATKLDARTHWHEAFKDANPEAYHTGAFSEVNKLHYSGPSLARNTDRIEGYASNLASGGLNITFKKAFGCVFGLRTGTAWEFYLQEVVSLTYIRPSTNTVVTVPRPIALRKIYPGTIGSVTILNETQMVKALPM